MRRIIYTFCTLLVLVATGCGSKNSGGSGGNGGGGGTNVPPLTDPEDIVTAGGETIELTLNKAALDQYVGWTTYQPKDLKVTVNLSKQGEYARSGGGIEKGFGGYISIQFSDAGQNYLDAFTSLWLGENNCGWLGDCNTVKNNEQNHRYNLLSTDYPETGGQLGFHGFFEDVLVQRLVPASPYTPIFGGGVILVIDSSNDNGDGQGPTSANGSIWFKNYRSDTGIRNLTNCWFISGGPFDCRAWKTSKNSDDPVKHMLDHKRSIYPDNGYVKLGSFVGLDMKKAFNGEI